MGVSSQNEDPPQYTRYRARRPLLGGGGELGAGPEAGQRGRGSARRPAPPGGATGGRGEGWRRWATPKRIILGLAALIAAWLLLSLVLFLISSHFNRTSPPPVRMSMIESDLPGPLVSAPGSLLFFWRVSEPSTRMLLAEVSG